jgi:predicted transcriptional regulator
MTSNKRKYETIHFVVDETGQGLREWGIQQKSSAVFVLDAAGRVLFAKNGELSDADIQEAISLIEGQKEYLGSE